MKRIVLLMLSLVMVTMAGAEGVTQEDALQQARSFVQKREAAGSRMRRTPGTLQLTLASKVSGLYVFNIAGDGGFVIVSNDDRTTPILGFSDSGSLNPDQMPENMRAWLQGYADEIAWLERHNVSIPAARAQRRDPVAKADIAPLVTTTWNQGTPYNGYCVSNTGIQGCVTGCVATAMAQVMNYHQWPTEKTANVLTHSLGGEMYIEGTTFDWANMLDDYAHGYTSAQSSAVAKLMFYCGISVDMSYGTAATGGSSASSSAIPGALKKYFGYNETTQLALRKLYSYSKWIDLIYFEVAHHRPVIYSGQSSGGGHAFVCDGYKYEDDIDFFHINWGWGGMSDEYFVLSALDPEKQGIGGSTSTDGYRYDQDAVIGIQKSTDNGPMSGIAQNNIDLTLNSMTLSDTEIPLGAQVTITLNITNNSEDDFEEGLIYVGRLLDDPSLLVGGKFAIPSGQTQDCAISFTPSETGTYNLLYYGPTNDGRYSTDYHVWGKLTVVPTGTPTHLTANDIRSTSVVLSWTETGVSTSWVVAYKTAAAENFTEVNVAENTYTLTGLTPETEYVAKVRPADDGEKWSSQLSFTTDEVNAPPRNLIVGSIAAHSAIVSWNGYADGYDVRYAVDPGDAGKDPVWLQYDNGTCEGGLGSSTEYTWTWGVMYPGSQVTGNVLTKISFFEGGNNTADITVKVYSGGDNAPQTLLNTITVTPIGGNKFHEITLDSPIDITPGENLWITLTETGTYIMCICESSEPNNQWVLNGGWRNVGMAGYGWMIRGYIETRDLGDSDVAWTTVSCTDNTYTLTGLTAEKDYVVQVRGIYGSDTKTSWVQKTFTTTAAPVPGDANGDGEVNVTDIMAVANFILGIAMENFNEEAANVNGDEDVNVTDIMGIANIILGVNTSSSRVVQETDMAEPQ